MGPAARPVVLVLATVIPVQAMRMGRDAPGAEDGTRWSQKNVRLIALSLLIGIDGPKL
jgi:hypothetical protein